MSVLLVTVSDDRHGRKDGAYSDTQDRVLDFFRHRPGFGIDRFAFWKWDDIARTPFYLANSRMLDYADPAMNGRCYKPFVILEGLESLSIGEFLIYGDVSAGMWDDYHFPAQAKGLDLGVYSIDVIKDLCAGNGGILSAAGCLNGNILDHTHENFTTELCLGAMGMGAYRHSLQHASGMMVIQKSAMAVEFAREWLRWNLVDKCASLGSISPDNPPPGRYDYWDDEVATGIGKLGHRHDQSVSGLLLNQLQHRLLTDWTNYNFMHFCRRGVSYEFIDGNQPPTPYRLICVDRPVGKALSPGWASPKKVPR